jgi:hypothetical protein
VTARRAAAARRRPARRRAGRLLARLALLGAALLGGAPPAGAEERILSFDAEITVQADGALVVREVIRVRAEGQAIRRGIYRDFPTLYHDRRGARVRVPFEVLDTRRDGVPEPRRQERLANGVRTYLGRADVLLAPGVYAYTIAYRTARQLGFFPEHDELYWNVTGNDWAFPIDRVMATVTLPPGVPRDSVRLEAYTGPAGARGRDWTAGLDDRGRPTFATTAPLGTREGLTIVVAWPKGHVAPPSIGARVRAFADDNWTAIAGAGGLALLLLYYLWAWVRVGRDPAGGVVIPRFVPPGGLSPAAVRYVWRMGFDDRTLAAAFLSLAVKGWLTIAGDPKEPGGIRLVRRPETQPEPVSAAEGATAKALFAGGDTVTLRPASHTQVGRARRVLRDQLAREYGALYFRTNRWWIIPGVALSILTVLAAAAGEGIASGGAGVALLFMTAWLTGWAFATAMLWANRRWVPAVIFTAFGLMGAGGLFIAGPPAAVLLLAVLAGANVLFYHLLKAPTRTGRRLLDEIEGLRMYLTVAERDRLNALHPPEETPATFERFLPYAFALDVDHAWAERFAGVLGTTDGHAGYAPAWYAGRPLGGAGGAPLSTSLAGLGPAVAAAASPPGSRSGRSGGGGGGSSGGGGGGGGGGGW